MAGHHSIHRQTLAMYQETTACAPPASWSGDGTPIEFISIDVNPKEALVADPTAERRILATGKRRRIRGVRNVDWSMVLKLHGRGAATVEDSQATDTYLTKILGWVCGGVHHSFTREVLSSTNAYTLTVGEDLTVGFVPGCLVAVEDTTSPTAQNAGKLHFARVASVNVGTDTIVLTEALPFTPAPGDVIHATSTVYVDETVLEDAIRNGAIHTMNWHHQRHNSGTEEIWQLEGTVASFKPQNLNRGQLPQLALSCMSANFRFSGDDGLTFQSFPAAEGSAQLSQGLDVRCSIASTAATTRGAVDVNAADFEPGFTRVRVETSTEEVDRFDGMSTYSVAPGDTKMTMTVLPHASTWYAAIADALSFRIMYYQPGPGGSTGASAGKAWAICVPKSQIAATPSRVDVNEVHASQVEFSAMVPDDTSGGSNAELENSPFVIGLA